MTSLISVQDSIGYGVKLDAAVGTRPKGNDSASTPAALISGFVDGQAKLVELKGQFERFCANQGDARCGSCADEQCRDKLHTRLIGFLNLANDIVHHERKLIEPYRVNPRYRKILDEHVSAHHKIVNDLSAYVMDCDRAPIYAVINAALATLVYWIDGHMETHDKALLDIVSGAAPSS